MRLYHRKVANPTKPWGLCQRRFASRLRFGLNTARNRFVEQWVVQVSFLRHSSREVHLSFFSFPHQIIIFSKPQSINDSIFRMLKLREG
jgi:hypothetical protein